MAKKLYIIVVVAETDEILAKILNDIDGDVIQVENTRPQYKNNREFRVIYTT